MKRAILIAVILLGCGEVVSPVETVSWDLWINHGQPESCHGSLSASLDESVTGTWVCGESGVVSGRANGNELILLLSPRYKVTASVREFDGAIIGTTDDGKPVVGYRQ